MFGNISRLLIAFILMSAVGSAVAEPDRVNKLNLTEEEQAWLLEHKIINVGFDPAFGPYSFLGEDGEYRGLSVDYMRHVSERLDIKFNFVKGLKWSGILNGVKNGSVDVVATAVKTNERESFLVFSDIYIPSPLVIIGRKNDNRIKQRDDLSGKKIALAEQYVSSERVALDYPSIKQIKVESVLEGMRAVSSGKADALVAVYGVASYEAKKAGLLNVKVLMPYDEQNQFGQRFGVRKDYAIFASILDKAIDSVSQYDKARLNEQWLPIDALRSTETFRRPAILEFSLTPEEKRWLNSDPVIKLAVNSGWSPIEFSDKYEKFSGISRDYIDELEKILGAHFVPVVVNKDGEKAELLTSGQIDLLPAYSVSIKNEAEISTTQSYLSLPLMIFSDRNAETIGEIRELVGKSVAAVEEDVGAELMMLNHPEIDLVRVKDVSAGLSKVVNGEVAGFIGNLLTTGFYMSEKGYSQIKIIGETPYRQNIAMATASDNALLLSVIEKALAVIDRNKRTEIYRRWVSVKYEPSVDYSLLWKIIVVTFAVIGAVVYWNRRLKKEVVIRTQLEHDANDARKELESVNSELTAANKKLKELDQLKSMFIASVSHELRTPLNSIIGFSDMMKRGVYGELEGKYSDYINRINASGHHLLSLISDIIDISKIESGRVDVELGECRLERISREAIDITSAQAYEKGLSLEVEIEADKAMFTDRRRLLQCILNLLSNAIKFTEKGFIRLVVTIKGERVKFEVIDSGIGIGIEEQHRLFEPFERIESHLRVKAGGTGLGLYLTKKIVKDLLHGSIGVESEEKKGSRFWIEVPAVIGAAVEESSQ